MENIFANKMSDKTDLELQEIIENRFDYQEEAYMAALYEIESRRRKRAEDTSENSITHDSEKDENRYNKIDSPEAIEEEYEEHKSFLDLLKAFVPDKTYFITPVIIYLNILIYTIMILNNVHPIDPSIDDLIKWGGNLRALTLLGEQWRLLTNTFLHGGIFHLLLNMYALLFIGKEIETQIGSSRTLFAYLFTGILASMASLAINENIVSVGASGAIFGMYGLLNILLTTDKIDLPKATRKNFITSVLCFVGYNLLYGFKEEGIDNAAHIGGLLSGLAVGGFFNLIINKSQLNKVFYLIGSTFIILLSITLPNFIPNYFANYNQLMNEFTLCEEKALSISKLGPNANNDQYLNTIREEGIPNWIKCDSLINQIDSIENLPLEILESTKLLKLYCTYRIESFRLMEKSLIEQTNFYDQNLNEYQEKINLIIDKLNGNEVADSTLIVNLNRVEDNVPLYVLDGVPQQTMPNIDSENLKSMEILKSETAIQLYGDRGKNGVILINTK
ncbi:MAG: rhomboid family intramembrane serine protease [Carboxylicivirga sp.]|jgi:rhomboid protease GluP|nr:rhomboid family intramembrane serine protease [Carboxylicivirga sp.]